jgi:hypothetical protein
MLLEFHIDHLVVDEGCPLKPSFPTCAARIYCAAVLYCGLNNICLKDDANFLASNESIYSPAVLRRPTIDPSSVLVNPIVAVSDGPPTAYHLVIRFSPRISSSSIVRCQVGEWSDRIFSNESA